MSWLSAAWTRNKGAIASAVSVVPGIGGIAAKVVNSIKTGDYVSPIEDPRVIAERERINAVAQAEQDRLRDVASNSVAQLGYSATTAAAAAIGPPGNAYQRVMQIANGNPVLAIGGAFVVLIILYMLLKRGR